MANEAAVVGRWSPRQPRRHPTTPVVVWFLTTA